MLTIGICENNCEHRKFIKDIIWNCFYVKADIKINEYTDGLALIKYISSGAENLDLLVLNINLPDMNGLNIADMIKRNSIRTDVIILTETERYVFDGYKYGIFDYVLKTRNMNVFKNSVERYAQEHIDSTVEYLCVKTRGCVQHIKLNKIDYFENRGRKMAAISEDEEFEFYFKMDDLLNAVPQDKFVRCHQSYVVNIKNIQSYTHSFIITRNNFNIPISRKYYQNLKQILDNRLIYT